MSTYRIHWDQIDPSRMMLMEMAPGEGLFFPNLYFGIEANRTGETMVFYTITYQR